MRQENQDFSKTLETIGRGVHEEMNGFIDYSNFAVPIASPEELIINVWGEYANLTSKSDNWMGKHAILCLTNNSVDILNERILNNVQAEEMVYKSFDKTVEESDSVNFPIEFLNSIEHSGIPLHLLKLKIGVPVILIRNLNPPTLCNGTRLHITKLLPNVIEARILTGIATGEIVYIPRIPLTPNNLPFKFRRVQFPVKVAFALTMNKSQGQTIEYIGLDFTDQQCFSHGQLYMGCSKT